MASLRELLVWVKIIECSALEVISVLRVNNLCSATYAMLMQANIKRMASSQANILAVIRIAYYMATQN